MGPSMLSEFRTIFQEKTDHTFPVPLSFWKGKGFHPLGYMCSCVPTALLSLSPFFPVRIQGSSSHDTYLGDAHLSHVACSYTRALFESALQGDWDELEGWIFTAGCDHLRRLKDVLEREKKIPFPFIFDIPHKHSKQAHRWFVSEVTNFLNALEKSFGCVIDENILNESIGVHNELCTLVEELSALRNSSSSPISSPDFFRLLRALDQIPRYMSIEILSEIVTGQKSKKQTEITGPRLIVIGSIMGDENFLKAINEWGGNVVAERFCTGDYPVYSSIELLSDPIESVVNAFFRQAMCPRMMETYSNRLSHIITLIEAKRIDGVVLSPLKSCDLWGIESALLLADLKKHHIPVISVGREYNLSGERQLQTRIEAFLEQIGSR